MHLENSFTDASQKEVLLELHVYEVDIAKYNWFKATGDPKAQELEADILKLRRLQYYARY